MPQRQPVSPLASPSTPIEPPRLLDMRTERMGGPPSAPPPIPRRAMANGYQDAQAAVQRENPQQPSQVEIEQDILGKAQGLMDNYNMRATLAEAPAPPGMGGDTMQPPTPPEQESFVAWSRRNYPQHVGRRVKTALIQSAHKQYLAEQDGKIAMFNAEVAAFKAKLASAIHIAEGQPKRMSEFQQSQSFYKGVEADRAEREFQFEKGKAPTTFQGSLSGALAEGKIDLKQYAKFLADSKPTSPERLGSWVQSIASARKTISEAFADDLDAQAAAVAIIDKELARTFKTGRIKRSGAVSQEAIQGIIDGIHAGSYTSDVGFGILESLGVTSQDLEAGNANANPFRIIPRPR